MVGRYGSTPTQSPKDDCVVAAERRATMDLSPHEAFDTHTATAEAVACAGRIFYRPERIVATLVARFAVLSPADFPGEATIAHACYEYPIRMAATLAVFGLRPLHWPMLNLLDVADRDRRTFSAAMTVAVRAARG